MKMPKKQKLGQYQAMLTSDLVNNVYMLFKGIIWKHRWYHCGVPWPYSTNRSTLHSFSTNSLAQGDSHESGAVWLPRYVRVFKGRNIV